MNISLCIIVLNEEGSIAPLLDSIFEGTKKPDEIVIVDGKSVDKTIEIIRHYQKKHGSIKLLIEKGGVAHGRNTSIEIAKGPIIAQIDAGCIAKKDWLEILTEPFENKKVDLAAGFYDMPAKGPIQAAINVFHGVPPERFNPTSFIPSARSVAFKKALWEKVGGYNEKLKSAGEDTDFFYKCVKTGARIVRVGKAKVIWEETKNMSFKKLLRKFFNYAKGDAKTGIWWHPTEQLASHNIKISSIFLRYMILIAIYWKFGYWYLLLFVGIYCFWSIFKWLDVISDWKVRLLLPVVQIISDFAAMSGFLAGTFGR